MNETKTNVTIFTDGGSRGNPGHSAYGFVIYKNGGKLFSEGSYLGIQTNNFAEYTAVIKALDWIKNTLTGASKITLYCDSLLVASQLSGKYKVKHPVIKQLVRKVKVIESFLPEVNYRHVPREQNKEADSLVNQALDNIS